MKELYAEGFRLAELAFSEKPIGEKLSYLEQTIAVFRRLSALELSANNSSKARLLQDKLREFEQEHQLLLQQQQKPNPGFFDFPDVPSLPLEEKGQLPRGANALQRGSDCHRLALGLEQKGQSGAAIPAYMDAADWYLKSIRQQPGQHDTADLQLKVEFILQHVAQLKLTQQQKAEQQKLEQQKLEQQKLEQQKLEQQKVEQQKVELQKLAQQKFAKQEQQQRKPSPQQQQQLTDKKPPPLPRPPYQQQRQQPRQKDRKPQSRSSNSYTKDELDVLRRSSVSANGRHVFQPWVSSLDSKENCLTELLFVDPDGMLPLSPSQEKHFSEWKRPYQIFTDKIINMIFQISPYAITQDIVTDCSFVASLCITSAYENRFNKKLITNIIYPQDTDTGIPIYNPKGKYIVKLWFNGVPRKVVVDDLLPVDEQNRLLVSCTNYLNKELFEQNPKNTKVNSGENNVELWVSIIEKAYMKINGGYNFPGSNSGIDLFALTGWIPEAIIFENDTNNKSEQIWNKMKSACHFGDCLITISTGELSKEKASELGLVPTHAYAVLNVIETSNGTRLLLVKNPWSRKGWKGKYSMYDVFNWTPELCQEINYFPDRHALLTITKHDLQKKQQKKIAKRKDNNGLFYIDYNSVCQYFHSLFLNWNPELFTYRTTRHKHWPVHIGPKNDTYNLGENPQYKLKVTSSAKSQSVWVLLSRHITGSTSSSAIQDQFLTLHVYDRKQGKRVFYSQEAMKRGEYSNNPHYLTCLDIPISTDNVQTTDYTLVVSQYEKLNSLDYTLSVYSTTPFELSEIDYIMGNVNEKKISSNWSYETAGGNPKHFSFLTNPMFKLNIPKMASSDSCRLYIFLQAPAQFLVNIRLSKASTRSEALNKSTNTFTSGTYRPGFCYLELLNNELSAGEYVIIPNTFQPENIGSFILTVVTDDFSIDCERMPEEGFEMHKRVYNGKWSHQFGTAVGCPNHHNYCQNPRFLLHVTSSCDVMMRLAVSDDSSRRSTASSSYPVLTSWNLSLFTSDKQGSLSVDAVPVVPTQDEQRLHEQEGEFYCLSTSNGGKYHKSVYGTTIEKLRLSPGYYVLVPSTFNPAEASFELIFYSSIPLPLQQIR